MNWKRLLLISIALIMIIPLVQLGSSEKARAMTGSGTPLDPYMIYDATDLQNMSLDLTAYYELANDIDASATVGWNGGAGFIPVGDAVNKFDGHLDGNDYTISELFINKPGSDYTGLFGYVWTSGTVDNVNMTDVTITGQDMTAALIGNNYGDVAGCSSTGSISGTGCTGGLVGQNYGNIDTSWSTCTITGIFHAAATDNGFGGLIGSYPGSVGVEVTNSFAKGNVTALNTQDEVGGFAGFAERNISNCYARGNASGRDWVGGFTGYVDATVTTSFSTGSATGVLEVGGFNGEIIGGAVTNCYWDTDTSGTAVSDGGTGLTTEEMKYRTNYTGFTFGTTWRIGEVVSVAATEVTSIGAVLNGTLTWEINNDEYAYLAWESVTTTLCGYQWGTDLTLANTTSLVNRSATEAYPFTLTGLTPNTTYYYRAYGTKSPAIHGATLSFMTGPCTLIPLISIMMAVTLIGGMFTMAFRGTQWNRLIIFMVVMIIAYVIVKYYIMDMIQPPCPRGWLIWG